MEMGIKATAAADSTPTDATPALLPPPPVSRPSPPPLCPLSSQYLLLLRPLLARAAQELRRFSRLDSHLGARWWYCTDRLTPEPAVSSAKIPLLETREVDTMGLRLVSAGVSRTPWHAAPLALVWSTRLHEASRAKVVQARMSPGQTSGFYEEYLKAAQGGVSIASSPAGSARFLLLSTTTSSSSSYFSPHLLCHLPQLRRSDGELLQMIVISQKTTAIDRARHGSTGKDS
ncbi:hypothetical protein INR49_018652 [Caranx melampygus]|nr:hypothetical protein INR49_018652 [Caranx melampygus]